MEDLSESRDSKQVILLLGSNGFRSVTPGLPTVRPEHPITAFLWVLARDDANAKLFTQIRGTVAEYVRRNR
jgi:hypothetical protein